MYKDLDFDILIDASVPIHIHLDTDKLIPQSST